MAKMKQEGLFIAKINLEGPKPRLSLSVEREGPVSMHAAGKIFSADTHVIPRQRVHEVLSTQRTE